MTDLAKFEVHAIHCNDETADVAMWCERAGCDFQFDGEPDEPVLLSTLVEIAEGHVRDAHPEPAP